MKNRYLACLMLLVAVTFLLAACGGGGGGPVPSVTLTAAYPNYFTTMPETFALANNTDTVTITAVVKNADGTLAVDGTPVRFTLPAGATFSNTSSATTKTTVGGTTAPVFVKHVAVTAPATNVTVPVTAAALGVGSAINVKFINQPASVDVSVALTSSLAGVGGVQLDINNTLGAIAGPAAPTTVGINAGTGGLAVTGFDAVNNVSRVVFAILPPGITVAALSPIIKITYDVTVGAGVSDFTPIAPFIVAGSDGANLISPSPTTQSFAITFKFNTE